MGVLSGADDAQLRAWMAAYQGGEIDGFERLYGALAASIRQYLTSLARDPARAQDLLQDTFLQVHRSRHTYDRRHPVRPWIFAIARHVYLMDARTRGRRREHVVDEEFPDVPVPPDVEALADRQRLGRALAGLIPERREALLLHHVWGLSFREIGDMLGIREAAAKLRSSRGMADLRRRLNER